MQNFLAFMQIMKLIGRMFKWLFRNYQITLISILFFRILGRIGNGEGNLGAGWDFYLILPLLIGIYKNHFTSIQKTERFDSSININNTTNIVEKSIIKKG